MIEPPTEIATNLPTFIVRNPVTLFQLTKKLELVQNYVNFDLDSFKCIEKNNTHAPEPAPIKICLVADFLLTSPKRRSKKDLASFPMCVISLLISFFKFFSLLRSLLA